MIAQGHECINHTHNHKCGGSATDCGATPSYGPAEYAVELDQSTQLIQTNTGVRPLFFIHPYDAYTPTLLTYLQTNLGYLGSRAGVPGGINTPNFTNFMNLDFYTYDGTANSLLSLKNAVDDVIAVEGYLLRTFHGVADPSWSTMTIANYTAHLDYVKTKMDAGLLWTATASEAITYKMQRDAYTIGTVYNATAGTINVNFTNTKTLNTAQLKTPVTVNVNLGTITGTFTVRQNTTTIPAVRNGNIVSFNVYPYQGNVIMSTAVTPPQPNNILNFSATPQSAAVALSWANPTANFDEVMIVAKATTAFTTQPSGTAYTADANFTGIGTAFEGGKVVYRGTGTSVTVTGLTNGTLYHFKAFSRLGTAWSSGVAVSTMPTAPSLVTSCFATWRDNKKAAYTIIHDDFGDFVTGIYDHAYPIATARGIKFSFGAITSVCGPVEWTKARSMMAQGHECINHSHNHKCGGLPADCIGVPTYGTADFAVELDQSTQLIQTNTGVRPLFFIHPYDSYTTTVLDYLQNNLGYLGSRAGVPGGINSPNFSNFMRLDFWGFDNSPAAITSLKTSVDEAIVAGGYLLREFHGINDQSFGSISSANYTTHLDYVKTKMDAGLLWTATASEAITYKMQRDAYVISTVYNATAGTINVNFINTKPINTAVLKTPVTVNVNLGTVTGNFTVSQNSTPITALRNGNIVSFNVYPHQGNVVLSTSITTPQPNNILNFLATPQSAAVALSWTNPTSNFDEVMIVAKATTAFTTQPTGTAYTADANFTGAGTAFEGGKVVYRGTGTSVTVTGLTNGTLYHFKAFSRLGTLWSSGVAVSATPTATVINPVPGCLKASYFSNITLTGAPVLIRAENTINYNWGTAAPITGLAVDLFSIRWEGTVNPPVTGSYIFSTTTDDGVRLWVNNVLVIDKWINQLATTYTASVTLAQGQPVSVRMEYYDNTGSASAKLEWTIPTQVKRVIAFDACPLGSIFDASLCYRLEARHSNRAISLRTNSNVDGIAIVQSTWAGASNQIWRIKQVDASYYQIVNGFSGKVVNVQSASIADNALINQALYQGTSNQLWNFDQNTEGYYIITAKHSSKVLDVANASMANNASIIQFRRTNRANQQWLIQEVACPAGLAPLATTKRIVTFNGRLDNNKAVLQWVVSSGDLKDY